MKKNAVIPLHSNQEVTRTTSPKETDAAILFESMIDGFTKHRSGTKRNVPKTVKGDIRSVRRLQEHSGKYPWEWSLGDWDNWNSELVAINGISAATQRKYQGSVKTFLKYLSTREVFQREAKQKFGQEIVQIIDEDEALAHIYERELKEPRPGFSPDQIELFFETIKSEILFESSSPTRVLLNLQRDFAMFYTIKATGLRAGSTSALNRHSFSPNPKMPEMGNFGAYSTVGKGSKGSGPKPIGGLVDDIKLPPILEWYITHVRPLFIKRNNPDEKAMFISERGTRLSYASLWDRFNKVLEKADLSGIGLCPHSLRHSKASESGMRYGVETTRRQLNHTYGTTTQGYMDIPDEYANDKINAHIREQVSRVAQKDLNRNKD